LANILGQVAEEGEKKLKKGAWGAFWPFIGDRVFGGVTERSGRKREGWGAYGLNDQVGSG